MEMLRWNIGLDLFLFICNSTHHKLQSKIEEAAGKFYCWVEQGKIIYSKKI